MKYLGIDLGKNKTGLSVSDKTEKIVVPYKTLKINDKSLLLKEILKIINELKIERVVIGYPLNINGTKSEQTKYIEEFANELQKNIGEKKVILYNEKYTTINADLILKEFVDSRKKRSKKLDEISALIILRDYLNSKKE
ncbi:MAG TPA: Holliday junction resolvase RuvX [bacterium]|nr:Holliday junction resolvase RuvX [bacterium]HOL48332.1 Holliday junction resolvase RuvX [bacterium]HPQ19847.1 Holliday junction resolvase RuvX [bacterium]